jgi:hypothetical protein
VFDLTFQKRRHDLVVATHGRGVLVLDDITPLELLTPKIENANLHLFQPQPAEFFHVWRRAENNRASQYRGHNPPSGAVITYWLKEKIKPAHTAKGGKPDVAKVKGPHAKTPVKIVVTDASGKVVHTLHGPGKQGMNRVAWNLRYGPPTKLSREVTKAPEKPRESWRPGGPLVTPGTYTVSVSAGDRTEKTTVTVKPDPRFPFDEDAAEAQLKAALGVRSDVSDLNVMLNRVQNLRDQLASTRKAVHLGEKNEAEAKAPPAYKEVLKKAAALDKKLADFMASVYNTEMQPGVGEDDIHYLARLHDRASGMMMIGAMSYDSRPRPVELEEIAAFHAEVAKTLDAFSSLLKDDVAAYNQAAAAQGLPVLFTGEGSAKSGG